MGSTPNTPRFFRPDVLIGITALGLTVLAVVAAQQEWIHFSDSGTGDGGAGEGPTGNETIDQEIGKLTDKELDAAIETAREDIQKAAERGDTVGVDKGQEILDKLLNEQGWRGQTARPN